MEKFIHHQTAKAPVDVRRNLNKLPALKHRQQVAVKINGRFANATVHSIREVEESTLYDLDIWGVISEGYPISAIHSAEVLTGCGVGF